MLVTLIKNSGRQLAGSVLEVGDSIGTKMIAEGTARNPTVGEIDAYERAESKADKRVVLGTAS